MDSDQLVIISYFVLIFITISFFLIYSYLSLKKEVEVLVVYKINQVKAIENLVHNFKLQFQFISLYFQPNVSKRTQPKVYFFLNLLGLGGLTCTFLALLLHSLGVVQGKEKLSYFLYILFLNIYLIFNQYKYYNYQYSELKFEVRFQTLQNTNFNFFEPTWSNYLQVIVLVLEFLQLLAFPLQDLISNLNLAGEGTKEILSIATLLPNLSYKFFIYQFWTTFGVVMGAVGLTLVFHIYNDQMYQGISLFWVSHLVPVVHVAYLPILVTFINSSACLLEEIPTDPNLPPSNRGLLHCSTNSIQPQVYLWLSLVGFTLAYLLLTVFVTSYEKKPVEGEIEFKSKGVAFLKNISLLLTITFTLIPNDLGKLKGTLSVVLLTCLCAYSIQSRPCYVSQINYWRTVGFVCILWASLPVAILDLKNSSVTLLILLICLGWLMIFVLAFLSRICTLTSTVPSSNLFPSNPQSNDTSMLINPPTNHHNHQLESQSELVGLEGTVNRNKLSTYLQTSLPRKPSGFKKYEEYN